MKGKGIVTHFILLVILCIWSNTTNAATPFEQINGGLKEEPLVEKLFETAGIDTEGSFDDYSVTVSKTDNSILYTITGCDGTAPVMIEIKESGEMRSGALTDHDIIINGEKFPISNYDYNSLMAETEDFCYNH